MNGQRSLKVLFLSLSIVLVGLGGFSFGQTVTVEARTHFDRGNAELEMASTPGDFQEAIKEFQQATQLAPDWADPCLNLGKVQEKVGKTEDAIASYRRYLALAPNAGNAEEVRRLVVKLQVQVDKEARLKKVYEMMVSPAYGRKEISSDPHYYAAWAEEKMGMVNGQMVAYNHMKELWNDWFPPKKFAPNFFPITVNGRFYEYRYIYYQCDMVGSRAAHAPPYCPFDVVVKGEVISFDPPTIKEVATISAGWVEPGTNPVGCPTGTNEFVREIVPK